MNSIILIGNVTITFVMSMPDVETKYADDYKVIFLNRTIGGIREGYVEMELVTESSDFEPTMTKAQFEFQKTVLKRVIHAKALIPLYSFKTTTEFFVKTLETYEKTFGKIPDLPKGPPQKGKDTGGSTDQSFIG